jgi:hypothetical protein
VEEIIWEADPILSTGEPYIGMPVDDDFLKLVLDIEELF